MDDLDLGATIKGFTAGQKVFGRYTLKKILGRGGMGVVWLAHDGELERDTALKFLPEVVAADRAAIADMKREVRRAIDLAHPHIVKIHDFVTDGRTAAVSMEHIAGDTLSSRRVDEPGQVFAVEKLSPWVGQLCAALDYAHQDAQVVHRDLKPTNLMLDARDRLKVLDFGIAASISDSVSRVSNKGSSSGTPVYMSPQQMMGEDPAVTDDIYALGALLFELLAGKPPFHAGNIMLQVQNKAAPLLNERRNLAGLAPVPAAWEATIAACLAKDPAARPQSAGEIAERLELTTKDTKSTKKVGAVAPNGPTGTAATSPARSTSRKPLFAAAAAGLIALVVAGLVLFNRRSDSTPAGVRAPTIQEMAGKPVTVPGLGIVLLPVPAGAFTLGTAKGGIADEQPLTQVTFTQPFWLGQTEVTQKQWMDFMGPDFNPAQLKGDSLPITSVRWQLAMIFCQQLTERERAAGRLPAGYVYSLPSEAQWEYAARAGTTTDTVADIDASAWHAGNSGGVVHPVGLKQANPWGFQDMLGNANEFCLDDHGPYPGGKLTDPVTLARGNETVSRGGTYQQKAGELRPGLRHVMVMTGEGIYQSFRLALIPEKARQEKVWWVTESRGVPRAGHVWNVPDLNLTFLALRPGSFTMGTATGGRDDERPVTRVTLTRPFWLGATEVTRGQWKALMGTSRSPEDDPDLPVSLVSWRETMDFCRKLTERERAAGRLPAEYSYVLPTEAQWEYACRAGSTGSFAGSLDDLGWYAANSENKLHRVRQKPANAWGLFGMHGNVAEYCRGAYERQLPGGAVTDPVGPASDKSQISRGGGYFDEAGTCRSSARNGIWNADYFSDGLGFRVALVGGDQ